MPPVVVAANVKTGGLELNDDEEIITVLFKIRPRSVYEKNSYICRGINAGCTTELQAF